MSGLYTLAHAKAALSETVAAPLSYVGKVRPSDDLAAEVFRFTDTDTLETFTCRYIKQAEWNVAELRQP